MAVDNARACLRELVKHVFERRDGPTDGLGLAYSDLSARIGRMNKHGKGNPRGMGPLLDKIGHLLQDLEGKWGEPIPQIQSLVVQKTGTESGLPSNGIGVFWPDYSKMLRKEKENRTRIEFKKVADFGSRWNDVLHQLELPEVTEKDDGSAATKRYGAGGESEAHKALKEFVRQHPEVVGAASHWKCFTEYPLPSLDAIDVLFKSSDACIAVEVKCKISDAYPADYERGLYQTIKYDALLRAMTKCGHDIPSAIRSVLVVESTLPKQLGQLAKVLGVKVYEIVDNNAARVVS
jgi:hypothetical protein